MTFWEHLDELRGVIFRSLAIVLALTVAAFVMKDEVFAVVLAPQSADFVLYRFLAKLSALVGAEAPAPFDIRLINTGLAQQFMIHVKTAFCVALICGAPFILHQLFGFVSPALYASERKVSVRILVSGYVMFMVGVLMAYFIIFPLTFRFLGTYQVASDISNLITLESYMSTLIMMCLFMGLMSELPVVLWIASRAGIVDSAMLRRYRRHAIVAILIVAAVITPTSDAFTLLVVSLPIWLLYELSVLITRKPAQQ